MITFFRRILNSKIGLLLAFVLLGVIALGFAAMDVQNLGGFGTNTGAGGPVAEVAGEEVPQSELANRVDQEWRTARQQQPTLDIAAFVAQGGAEQTLERIVNGMALQAFAQANGMRVSERLVEGRIASIPAFQGPSGKFDQAIFRQILASERISEAQLRADIARETLVNQLMGPIVGAAQVSQQLATPYANLLLERRTGQFALIPATALPEGAEPTAQEIQTYYQRNIQRFTIPQRRVVQYAAFDKSKVAEAARPTDAEIAQTYNANRAQYAARETRDLTQVIVADQAGANAIAERVRGGATLAAAAQAAGLEATTIGDVEKAALAGQSSQAVADAAFSAAEGAVAGPVRSALGWHVVRVEDVAQIAGRSLEQAREEIAAELTTSKAANAMADLVTNIENAVSEGASFTEVAQQFGLTPVRSPAVTSNGMNPDAPQATPAPELTAVLQAAFEAEQGDDPQVASLPGDTGYVLWGLESIVPATPRPLAQVRDTVARSVVLERQQRAARTAAREVVAKINRGTSMAQALRETGLTLPPSETVAGTRSELTSQQGRLAPPIALMFSMAEDSAKQLEAPNNQGFLVVYLDEVVEGDASKSPEVIAATRAGLGRVAGQEYAEQFTNAVRAAVGTTINTEGVAAAKRQISGGQ
ncbi:peptidylprolyl isomerase [Sphingomonas gilva]|nr:peptidylprolyl isomerase [Sphingomonas gilva]